MSDSAAPSSVRVYVGGLPADVKVQELRERFGQFLQPMKVTVQFQGKRKTEFIEEEELEEQIQVQGQGQEETDSESSEEEQSEEQDEDEDEDAEDVLDEDDVEAFVRQMEESEEQDEDAADVLDEDDVEAFVRQMEEEAAQNEDAETEKPKQLSREEVNARRLAALEAKQQRKKQEQSMIPATGAAVANKKITFDDSGNEQDPEEQEREEDKVVSNWMDSSDEEAGDEKTGLGARKTFDFTDGDDEETAADAEAQAAFALRPEFTGERGKKLFEMQKRFGGDSRFRLDARFLEEEANEFGGNDVDEEELVNQNEDAVVEMQNFLEESNSEEAARHAREMHEEEEAALRVVAKLFPDVDVMGLQRRMRAHRAPKDPLKEAAWMGNLKRYDPRDAHACRELEIPMSSASPGEHKGEEESTVVPKREEKEIPTGGDRFFSTSGNLGNMFSRVRKNSEDGEEGEAALDGVFGFSAPATETIDDAAPFKLSSLFSFPVGEDKPLAAMGESLLEDEQDQQEESSAGDWRFSQGFHPGNEGHEDEAVATDSEDGDDVELDDAQDDDGKSAMIKKRAKKSLEDFLAFGRTFVGGDEVQDWTERRKKLTLDYKRKRRDAIKMKKRQNKQQHKANKAGADSTGTSKWKKARL
ncbi:hypothetical protein BBO99_00005093 [Phytophthora kernoviae]|uniref:RRM domain-containing protein n=1 Tax=Phytophthora kernoviae TaxID=325452 RepID=A0A421GPE0_9STRA|nr:hypothetical protein BBI17_005180 [Phytophthora kernoviae]RLN79689.1 hypothetical protein BBO99_00005093 [Phytophthora kernoviae]